MTRNSLDNAGKSHAPLRENHEYETHSDKAGHIRGATITSGGLIRATLGSIAAALIILALFWLPAEYGTDPTGLGRMMGLTQMGEIKQQLFAEQANEEAVLAAQAAAAQVSADPALIARLDALERQVAGIATAIDATPQRPSASSTDSPIEAAASPEVVALDEQSTLSQWRDEMSYTLAPAEGVEIKLVMNEGTRAQFEWTANGSILNYDTHGDGNGQRVTYERGRGVPDQSGELVADFDGNHGWFWRNRTDAPVTFTLRTRGDYERINLP